MDGRKCKLWDDMKMTNVIKVVKNDEMGIKKTSKVFEMSGSTLKNKVNSKETVTEELINT